MDKSKFKKMFSEYCKSEINKGRCEDADCSFCVVNAAYDSIFQNRNEIVIAAAKDALCQYSAENVDVVRDEETNMLDVIYHSRHNSFAIQSGVACCDEVDFTELENELDDLGVGYCW